MKIVEIAALVEDSDMLMFPNTNLLQYSIRYVYRYIFVLCI